MRAIGCEEYGTPEVLHWVEVPEPKPGPRDLLVRVHAAALNPIDWKVVSGLGKMGRVDNPPLIVGWDGAGLVEKAGKECSAFRAGDAVYFCGSNQRPGCHAEVVLVDERLVGRKPSSLSFEEAAAIPLTGLTAWEAFIENLGAPTDGSGRERCALVIGGAGGVGSIAIQVAKKVCGMRVVATASRVESRAFCERMGADDVIDHSKSLLEETHRIGRQGYDYILSTVDSQNFQHVVSILNPLGKVCYILPATEPLNLSELFWKRGTLSFEMVFARSSADAEPEKQGAILNRLATMLDTQNLVTTLSETHDWGEFAQAYRRLQSGHTLGKIVLSIRS